MKYLSRKAALLGGVAAFSLLAGTSAWAQAQQQTQQSGVEVVTVTAEKQTETSLEVPMGLTALRGEDLVRHNQTSFQDYVGTVPGLTMSDFAGVGTQLIVRGLSTGLVAINPSAATYIDDTPYAVVGGFAGAYGSAPNLDTYDMNNIEVLKGPQGTLYGASALGGLLKYVTNAPDPSGFAASGMAGISSVYNGQGPGFDLHGMVNIPITDDLAARFVAYETFTPGYIDNPYRGLKGINQSHTTGGRASVLWQPESDLSVRLTGIYQERKFSDFGAEFLAGNTQQPYPNNNAGQPWPIYSGSPPVITGYDLPSHCYQPAGCPGGQLNLNNYTSQPGEALNEVVSLSVNWNAGPFTATSVTSYAHFLTQGVWDYSGAFGIPAAVYDSRPDNIWTQEIRLASPTDNTVSWLVGGYFNQSHDFETEWLDLINTSNGALIQPPIEGFLIPTSYQEFAGFANVTWHINPVIDAAIGGRYSVNSQTYFENAPGTDITSYGQDSYEHTTTYSGDLRWHFMPGNMAYARIATGFAPGGPNDVTPSNPDVPHTYGPSTTLNYEIGAKGSLLDNHFSYDVDAFLIDWKSIQLELLVSGYDSIVNGGNARSQGIEWDFKYSPLDGLQLDLNGDYTNAYLAETTPGTYQIGAHAGMELPYVPEWQGSASIDYERPVWGDWSGFGGIDVRYSDFRLGDFNADCPQCGSSNPNPPVYAGYRPSLPTWVMLDFRVGIENDKYSASLYCKNCTNVITPDGEYAWNAPNSTGEGIQQGAIYEPRVIGIEVSAKY